MELDTSKAIMISTPVRFISFTRAPVRGRDNPRAKKKRARQKILILSHPLLEDTPGVRDLTNCGSPKRFNNLLLRRLYRP